MRSTSSNKGDRGTERQRMTPRAQFEPNVFTCTFCYRLSAQKPHVLGRSARLTCAECYGIIINLSICWACGELVLREADSVSFGWCFWHRACYGCLLYGNRKLCTGMLDSPKAGASINEDADDGLKRRGEDMLQAPLCALCAVECEVDSLDEYGVVQRGLKRIDLVDGGVTRRRWMEKARHGQFGPGHMFWVHMDDPVNGPSFRPYPSKPLPLHMQHAFEHEQASDCRRLEQAERWKRHSEPCRTLDSRKSLGKFLEAE